MKKQSLLFVAGLVLALTSCQTETESGYSEAQIDSTVNARVDERMIQLMAANDSTINALAAARADSIVAAMKGAKSVTTTTKTTRTTTVSGSGTTTTTAPATAPTKDDRLNVKQDDGRLDVKQPKDNDGRLKVK